MIFTMRTSFNTSKSKVISEDFNGDEFFRNCLQYLFCKCAWSFSCSTTSSSATSIHRPPTIYACLHSCAAWFCICICSLRFARRLRGWGTFSPIKTISSKFSVRFWFVCSNWYSSCRWRGSRCSRPTSWATTSSGQSCATLHSRSLATSINSVLRRCMTRPRTSSSKNTKCA